MKFKTIEQFKEVYDDWSESKLSIKEFCSRNGLKEATFYYWKKKVTERNNISIGRFIPIQANPQISPGHNTSSVPSSDKGIESKTPDSDYCEIVYSNGVTLKVRGNVSLDVLRALISLNP